MTSRTLLLIAFFELLVTPILAQSPNGVQAQACNAPGPDVVTNISLPGAPFSAIPTANGCTIFVSLLSPDPSHRAHIAVLTRAGGHPILAHDVVIPGANAAGMALSHDGAVLALADGDGVSLYDTTRLERGDGTPLARATDQGDGPRPAGSVYVAITPDDKLLFVSDENAASLSVYDLAKLRTGNTKAIGRIQVGNAPVGLVFSPDGRRLYSTSEIALPPTAPVCPAEQGNGMTPPGLLAVIDTAKAAIDPANAVLANVPGGCDPVRVALSTDGARAYVTARGQDALLIFDTAKLTEDGGHALLATIKSGKSPVGVAVANQRVFAADSNRFDQSRHKGDWLSVIDPAAAAVTGAVPAGLFPRELAVTADGKTLLATNYNSKSLQLVDLARLTPAYLAQQKANKDADNAVQAKTDADRQARLTSGQPRPGSETALRKFIAGMLASSPDYADMTPTFVTQVQSSAETVEKRIQAWGALQSVTFATIDQQDRDVFDVIFTNQKTRWTITLAPDGKMSAASFGTQN